MSKRRLRPEEQRAWARVARSVKARPGAEPAIGTAPIQRIDPETTGARAEMDAAMASEVPPPTPAPYPPRLGPLPNRKSERRIRRGQAPIAGRFDLHGHTQDSAHRALPVFLSNQRASGARCVLVITGKGRMGEGVLRRNFLHWLETPSARALVSGYAPAHARHGGDGAFYVFLRRL